MRSITMAPPLFVALAVAVWMVPFILMVVWIGVTPSLMVALWAYAILIHVLWWRGVSVALKSDTALRAFLFASTLLAASGTVLATATTREAFLPGMMLTNFLGLAQLVVSTIDITRAEQRREIKSNVLINILQLAYLMIGVWFLRPRIQSLASEL
jgi:hypothetical protein